MNEQTQTTNQIENFIVLREGIVDQELSNIEPVPTVLDIVRDNIGSLASNVVLQAKMQAYDTMHHTNYRTIRNELMNQKRNKAFEQSIGIVATKK